MPISGQPPTVAQQEAEKRAAAERELLVAYRRCFATDSGKVVLADLKRKVGYKRSPYTLGIGGKDLAFRCGGQEVVHGITLNIESPFPLFGQKPKNRKARSNHE